MKTEDVAIPGLTGPGLLRTPEGATPPRGAVVALHGAALPQRDQVLFEHLARTLTPLGLAVLSYDRRPAVDGGDVPLEDQVADAQTARSWLVERYGVPVGLYGFSQGGWAAVAAAAADPTVSSLALVGFSGVSPAVQMRFHTDELLRRAGHDDAARASLRELRLAMEDVLRGVGDRAAAARLLEASVAEPWFELAYLPPELPPEGFRWEDLDADPAAMVARVRCRTLLLHGTDEDTVPVVETRAVWREHGDLDLDLDLDLTTVDLDGCGHFPRVGTASPDEVTVDQLSPAYTAALQAFFAVPGSTTD